MMIAGVPGFGFGSSEVYGVHVAWSGNTVHRVERVPSGLGVPRGPDQRLVPG
jgi:alpha-galactosidase